MNTHPLVSVIMPAYNRAQTLPAAIASVTAQSYGNWELIVVDDRSTDTTKEVVAELAERDSRIQCIANERTKGVGGARNTGMLQAKGDFIAFLDSDDEWLPFHLEETLRMIRETQADVGFALWLERQGDALIDAFEEPHQRERLEAIKRSFHQHSDDVAVMHTGLFERYVKDTLCIFHINTMVFKREKLQPCGMFLEEFHIGEDSAFMINFFDQCRISLHMKPHSIYNLSPDSIYFFVDRRKVDPDRLHLDKAVLQKLETAGLQALAFKQYLRRKIEECNWHDRKRLLLLSSYTLARQYYTLSYIHRFEKRKAIRYCLQSMKHNVNSFNLLLLCYILFSVKRSNSFLRKPVDLW
ncbi:glycosyltransferase family 2 protein [Paenibacillus paeoniae]|uniref:Glycosyltransferase family 2 protein n=1 Tax=Paenibacillus paeoniae TaxID=2292705 RepID=A0A371P7C2_9BACL|nr:glycosyltransferase family 2 protein [Paenibacillus paeoniae]REK71819.1 glycosyltransferase family 2 protein [Paenibacillus paeoniae]